MAQSASRDCNERADRDWMFSHEEIREMIRIHREWLLHTHESNTIISKHILHILAIRVLGINLAWFPLSAHADY